MDLTLPDRFRLDVDDYELGDTIGSGTFGCTMMARLKKGGPIVALKVQRVRDDKELRRKLDREIGMSLLLSHSSALDTTGPAPFFGKTFGAQLLNYIPDRLLDRVHKGCPRLYQRWYEETGGTFDSRFILIWMELSEGMSTDSIMGMDNVPPLDSEELRSVIFGFIWGLHGASQEYGFTHNDLNAGNIIVHTQAQESYYRVKGLKFYLPQGALVPTIIDFGNSTIATNYWHKDGDFSGAPAYVAAPEVTAAFLNGTPMELPTIASDLYAIAHIIILLLTHEVAFTLEPETRVEDSMLHKLMIQPAFREKPGLNDMYGYETFTFYHASLVYAYEMALVLSGQDSLPRMKGPQGTWQVVADSDRLFLWSATHNTATHGMRVLREIGTALFQNYRQDAAQLMSLLKTLLSWDPADRVGRNDSLYPLLEHPYFEPLRVERVGLPLYITTDEGSLLKEEGERKEARIRDIKGSGFRIDKRIK